MSKCRFIFKLPDWDLVRLLMLTVLFQFGNRSGTFYLKLCLPPIPYVFLRFLLHIFNNQDTKPSCIRWKCSLMGTWIAGTLGSHTSRSVTAGWPRPCWLSTLSSFVCLFHVGHRICLPHRGNWEPKGNLLEGSFRNVETEASISLDRMVFFDYSLTLRKSWEIIFLGWNSVITPRSEGVNVGGWNWRGSEQDLQCVWICFIT